MKDYKRLTKRITASNTGRTVLVVPSFKQDIIEQTHRLADLEDKIERGELVDRNSYLDYLLAAKDTSELTNKDKEIEFFVKHNARVREDTDKELARLTAENKVYADNILRAIIILQNSEGFKAQTAINQAIGVLLGNKDNKCKREID